MKNLFRCTLLALGCVSSQTAFAGQTRVLAFGDWGGSKRETPFDRGIAKKHKETPYQGVILLGDNFYSEEGGMYSDGVKGPDDPQFNAKFENRLARNIDQRFYAILGNHDYFYDYYGSYSDTLDPYGDYLAQVEYTYYGNKAGRSGRWYMPNRYYEFKLGDIHFFALDIFPAHTEIFDKYTHNQQAVRDWGKRVKANGQANEEWFKREAAWQHMGHRAYMQRQLQWLAQEMSKSDATWKVVLTHYPLISNQYGKLSLDFGTRKAQPSKEQLTYEEILDAHADLVVAAHDHSLQWHNDVVPGGVVAPLPQLISGATGHAHEPGSARPNSDWSEKNPGFAELVSKDGTLEVEFYKVDKEAKVSQVMEFPVPKRHK